MSAINDALRRASSAAKTPTAALPPQSIPAPMNASQPPWAAPVPPPPPAPVAPPPIIAAAEAPLPPLRIEPAKKSSKLTLLLALLFLCCLGGVAALYFFGKGRLVAQARETVQPQGEITDNDRLAARFGDPKAVSQAAESVRSNQVSAKPEPSAAPVEPASKTVPAVATTPKPAPAPTPAAAPRAPAQFPPLRLQSIFYRPANPSVMINGKTLFVSDEINGVLVADIQPSSVTLVLSGQTNILTLR